MSATPTLVAPLNLVRTLRRGPPSPRELLRLLSHAQVELTFRQMVREFLPDDQTVSAVMRSSP